MWQQFVICIILLVYFQQYMYVESMKTKTKNKILTRQHQNLQQTKNGKRLFHKIPRIENNKIIGIKIGRMKNKELSKGKQSNRFNMSMSTQEKQTFYNECCKICCGSGSKKEIKMDSKRVKRGWSFCNKCLMVLESYPCTQCGFQGPSYDSSNISDWSQPSHYPSVHQNWQQPSSPDLYQPLLYQPSIPNFSQQAFYPQSSSAYHQHAPSSSNWQQPSHYPSDHQNWQHPNIPYLNQPPYYPQTNLAYHQNPSSNSYSSGGTSGGSVPANSVITVNGNEYNVVEVLGRSTHKAVYHVKRNGHSYALKRGVKETEIEAIRECQGIGVIGYIDSDESGSLVMEMDEKSLAEALEHKNLYGPIHAGIIKIQLEKGLETIHNAGYVHRDLDVLNVMFLPGPILKITDFGEAIKSTNSEDRNFDRRLLVSLIQRIEQNFYGNDSN